MNKEKCNIFDEYDMNCGVLKELIIQYTICSKLTISRSKCIASFWQYVTAQTF